MLTLRSSTTGARPLKRLAALALAGLAPSLALVVGSSPAHAASRPLAARSQTTTAADALSSFTTDLTPDNTGGLQLGVSEGSTTPGTGVIDWWSDGGAEQEWTFTPINNGEAYEIINQNSGQCLTTDGVAGDQVYQEPCVVNARAPHEPTDNAQWWTTSISASDVDTSGLGDNIIYYPIVSVESGLYLDVSGDNPFPGATIDTWYSNGGRNQEFAPQ